jgi:hypothetical protein
MMLCPPILRTLTSGIIACGSYETPWSDESVRVAPARELSMVFRMAFTPS